MVSHVGILPAAMARKGQTIGQQEQLRFANMQQIGCIPCILEGELRDTNRRGTPGDVNHLLQGQDKGYRLGHQYTVCECPWHHRGVLESPPIYSEALVAVVEHNKLLRGPSRALHNREFHERYGTDVQLLARQNREIQILQDLTV